MMIDLVHGVLVAARLWQQLGAAQRAAEWTGLLLSRPGVERVIRKAAATMGRELEAELGPAGYAAALERGRTLSLDEGVAQIRLGLAA